MQCFHNKCTFIKVGLSYKNSEREREREGENTEKNGINTGYE